MMRRLALAALLVAVALPTAAEAAPKGDGDGGVQKVVPPAPPTASRTGQLATHCAVPSTTAQR